MARYRSRRRGSAGRRRNRARKRQMRQVMRQKIGYRM